MSAIKDAIAAMNKIVLMNDKIERTGKALSEISKELRDHESRLIRVETFVEIAKTQQAKLPEK